MGLVAFAIITVRPMLEFADTSMLFVALIFPGAGFFICLLTLTGAPAFRTITVNGKPTTSPTARIIFGLIFGLIFGGMPWAFFVLPALLVDTVYWVTYLSGMLCIAGMIILNRYMSKRTSFGNEILGRIKGFKTFLVTAEKHKLETLVMQDPTYFYNILPFTYVLGVSDKWINKFESISIPPPEWYTGNTHFSTVAFGHFINSTMQSATTSMSSSPSSGSSSSGGGSSGHGSGGGGGHSW
jgi:uncharacterized membrane protein